LALLALIVAWGGAAPSGAAVSYAGNIWIIDSLDKSFVLFMDNYFPTTAAGKMKTTATPVTPTGLLYTASAGYLTPPGKTLNWRRYSIQSSSKSTLYLLFYEAPKYAVVTISGLSVQGGVNYYIDKATWYAEGTPPPPSIVTLTQEGYDGTGLNGLLSSSYASTAPKNNGIPYQLIGLTAQMYRQTAGGPVVEGASRTSNYNKNVFLTDQTYFVNIRYNSTYFGSSAYTSSSPVYIPPLTLPLKTAVLTLEGQTPAGPGINFIALPFGSPWYANGTLLVTALDLVKAFNLAANNTNVVSTFVRWNNSTQKDERVLIPDNDPDRAASLGSIFLRQGEGYQVYLTGTNKVELLIRNKP